MTHLSSLHHQNSLFLPNVNNHDLDENILSYLTVKDIVRMFQLNKAIHHTLLHESNDWLWIPMYNRLYVSISTEPWNMSYVFPYLKGVYHVESIEAATLAQQKNDSYNSYQQNYTRRSLLNGNKWKELEQKMNHARDIENKRIQNNNLNDNEPITLFHCIVKPQFMLTEYFGLQFNEETLFRYSRFEPSTFEQDLRELFEKDLELPIEKLVIQSFENDESFVDYLVNNSQNKNIQRLRALHIGEVSYQTCEMSWMSHCDKFGSLIHSLPINYFVSCGAGLVSLKNGISTQLISLVLVTGGINRDLLHSLFTEVYLPNLAHLELWLGQISRSSFSRNAMYKLMKETLLSEEETGFFPRLRYLGLRNSQHINALAKLIPYAAITQRIRTLDMSHGMLNEHGIYRLIIGFEDVLSKNHNAFDQLSELILRTNFLVNDIIEYMYYGDDDSFESIVYGSNNYDDYDDAETKAIGDTVLIDNMQTLVDFCAMRDHKTIYQILYETLGKEFAIDASESYSGGPLIERFVAVGE
jgi:hypothetical protein